MTLFNERFLAGMDACSLDPTNYMTFLMQNCVVTRPSERKKPLERPEAPSRAL